MKQRLEVDLPDGWVSIKVEVPDVPGVVSIEVEVPDVVGVVWLPVRGVACNAGQSTECVELISKVNPKEKS